MRASNLPVEIAEVEPAEVPMELLLEADPSVTHIQTYLPRARCFLARVEGGNVVGACVIRATVGDGYEVMNVAVVADQQRRGIGSAMLRHAIACVRTWGARRLELGTGTFGFQAAWYQRAGFRALGVDPGHFLREYREPIFEGGRQHKDMLRLAIDF